MALIKLIATDIDGTLIGADGKLSKSCLHVASLLRTRGIRLLLMSGRRPAQMQHFYDALGLSGPAIASNGAMVFTPGPRIMRHSPIGREISADVVGIAHQFLGPELQHVGVQILDDWYVDEIDDALGTRITEGRYQVLPRVANLIETVRRSEDGATFIYVRASQTVLTGIRDEIGKRHGIRLSMSLSPEPSLNIASAAATKGEALRFVSRRYGIGRQNIAAIGDGDNDISAFRIAGVSIAMGNSPEHVQAAADYVAPSNTEEGWSKAIEEYVLDREGGDKNAIRG